MLEKTKCLFIYIACASIFACTGNVDYNALQTEPHTIKQDFYSNGDLATETGFNKEGLMHGPYKEWLPNGKLQVEKVYHNGELQSEKLYTIDGKIIQNIVYKDGRKYGLLFSSFCMNSVSKSEEKDSLIFNSKN